MMKSRNANLDIFVPVQHRLPPPPPWKVLVVDDNDTVAKTLSWMIEAMGHRIETAFTGEAALAQARRFLPDIVLLDIGLKDMNGYDVCRQLRNDPALRHCIIIAQTGWSQPEHRLRAQEAGFDYLLVKPVMMETLEEIFKALRHAGEKVPAA